MGNITIGPDGTLYGTTNAGGTGPCIYISATGCGTVFNIKPPPTRPTSALSPWIETVLYRFTGNSDGAEPASHLAFDSLGVMYGTTRGGGYRDNGVVFTLTPAGGGTWSYNTLYTFTGGSSGRSASGGVLLDSLGNLYGTTAAGGTGCADGCGKVYELTLVDGVWTEITLHDFEDGNDGNGPVAPLIFDAAGNIYGGTQTYASSGGSVFELTPSESGWSYQQIYNLPGYGNSGVMGPLMVDSLGNVYGTCSGNGLYENGTALELSPSQDGWSLTTLHDFDRGSLGGGPWSNLTFDSNGHLLGTAQVGGAHDKGVIFEIAP